MRAPSRLLRSARTLLGLIPPVAALLGVCLWGGGAAPVGGPPSPDPIAPAGSRWADVDVPPPTGKLRHLPNLGEEFYGWHCLPCHGPDGKGDGPNAARLGLRPRDFTRGLFRFKTSAPGEMPFDDDLFRTLTVGVPIAGMPAFTKFTSDELWTIVDHVKSLSGRELPDGEWRNHFESWPAKTRIPIPPVPPRERSRVRRGGHLYLRAAGCVQCHGEEGRGDGPAAATLRDSFGRPIGVPDFTRGEVLFKTGNRPEDIFRVLTVGMPGTPMPSFASLSEQDRWDLAFYVTSLYRPVHPGEKVFLWRGCVQCHTIGRGRHLGPDLIGIGRRRTPEWIRRWIRDPLGLIASDWEAQQLLEQYGLPMPDLKLKEEEIDAVVDFLMQEPGAARR